MISSTFTSVCSWVPIFARCQSTRTALSEMQKLTRKTSHRLLLYRKTFSTLSQTFVPSRVRASLEAVQDPSYFLKSSERTKWSLNKVITRRAHRSTYINNFTKRQGHCGRCLQQWKYAWVVVNSLDCSFQTFIRSTSAPFHSMFPCQRRERELEDCRIFAALWVDLVRWCSTLHRQGIYGSSCVIGGDWLGWVPWGCGSTWAVNVLIIRWQDRY